MGAIGLNGAASDVTDHSERAKIAADGWARWSPVNVAAIGIHLVGGLGLILANRDRVRDQSGVTSNTAVKTLVTAAAMAATAYSGVLGAKIGARKDVVAEGATTPSTETPDDVATAQSRLKLLQWSVPVLTGVIVVMGAQQGEQQRASQVIEGTAQKARKRNWH